eukprot:g12697.t1
MRFEDFVIPKLFDSLGLESNAKLFDEAQVVGRRSLCGGPWRGGWGRGRGKDAANKNSKAYYEKSHDKTKDRRRGAGYNHLTIIATGGQVIAWGFNSLCSGPQASVHSEVTALRALFSLHSKAGRRGVGVGRRGGGRGGRYSSRGRHRRSRFGGGLDLVNVRFTFDSLRISRPCRRCWQFLNKHLWRFRRVMYTTSEGGVVCLSADEFAADPPDHVSKGHRRNYYGGGGGSSGGGSGSRKKQTFAPEKGGKSGRAAVAGRTGPPGGGGGRTRMGCGWLMRRRRLWGQGKKGLGCLRGMQRYKWVRLTGP